MLFRVKLYTLEQEDSQSTFFGHIRVEEGDCYDILKSSLEKKNVLDWPFHFFNVKEGVRIRMRLKSLDTVPAIVHVICADSETTVAPKCRCVEEVAAPVVSNDTPI